RVALIVFLTYFLYMPRPQSLLWLGGLLLRLGMFCWHHSAAIAITAVMRCAWEAGRSACSIVSVMSLFIFSASCSFKSLSELYFVVDWGDFCSGACVPLMLMLAIMGEWSDSMLPELSIHTCLMCSSFVASM